MAVQSPDGDTRPAKMSMLDCALEYLQLGYSVFPVCSPAMRQHRHGTGACTSVGKRALVRWEPFQSRLPTAEEVREWWSRWPVANIGMATGQLSGVVVLDADSSDAKKLAMSAGGLDKTPAVFTGKPGGMHFWLAWPGHDVSNFARKRPGLDFRGDGGYVLVPPSLHISGARYRWVDGTAGLTPAPVPDWLLALLRGDGEPSADGGEPAAERFDLEMAVTGVPEGQRDDALWRLTCKLRDDDVPRQYAEVIVRQAARACSPPFDEAVALEKVERAWRTYAPAPRFAPSGSFSTTAESVVVQGEYAVQTVSELVNRQDDAVPHLVDGILWSGRTTWIFSDPNAGKTLFTIALLMHIAAGRPFCGRAVEAGTVLMIEEDSPLSVTAEYVELLAEIYDFDLETLPFWINRDQGLRIVDADGVRLVMDAINSCPQRPAVVVFDACERLVPSDRFTTKELDPLTQLFQWCTGHGVTPVMIDHTTKAQPHDGEATIAPMDRLYGARAKSAISDVMLYMSGSLKAGGARVSVVKFRGDPPAAFTVEFDPRDGFRLRGEKVQSRSPAEQDVMRFFDDSPPDWYRCVEVEEATGRKRRTVQRALSAMVARGWLLSEGDGFERRYRRNPAVPRLFG
jgi:hypothetical protein